MTSFRTAPVLCVLTLPALWCVLAVPVTSGQPVAKKVIKIAVPVKGIVAKVNVVVGDHVKAGEILIQLDDRLARNDVDRGKAQVQFAREEHQAAMAAEAAEEIKYKREQLLLAQNASTQEAVAIARLVWEQHIQQTKSRAAAIRVAEIDLEKAKVVLGMHQVRAPSSGTVQATNVAPGEGVKELDIVVEIAP